MVTSEDDLGPLQARLHELWPTMTTRSAPADRTVIVLHSVGMELPAHLQHVVPAYEERYLCAILSLLRQPDGRVIYLTSLPVLPRLIDYYLGLMPGASVQDLRGRLSLVSVGDGSSQPLTEKVLARPLLMVRLLLLTPNPERALILPFMTGPAEVELAVKMGIALYGPPPALARFSTKSGSRQLFAEEGVPHAPGVGGVRSVNDVVEAVKKLIDADGGIQELIVKMDVSAGGLGNAIVRLDGASEDKEISSRVRALQPDDANLLPDAFLEELAYQGGVVEVRLKSAEVRSPSAQMRSGPGGEFELVSTHDQILGGANGMTFLGCTFPADKEYRKLISEEAVKIGRRLTREGMVGRFAVDFIVTREQNGQWKAHAIEINLRSGGTTHPWMAAIALTDGTYDEDTGELVAADGRPRCYIASDHVESPAYQALTPDDLLDLTQGRLRWDHERSTGVVFHMVSAIAGAGRTGVTAIAERPEEARAMFDSVTAVLDETASRASPPVGRGVASEMARQNPS